MLRAADEVRAAQFGGVERDLDAEMVAIARAIIGQRTGSFDPATYRDRYQEALRELIEAKIKGLTVEHREMAAVPPVIDLIAVLKRSLAQEAPARATQAASPLLCGLLMDRMGIVALTISARLNLSALVALLLFKARSAPAPVAA
jgi:non-homologous end joining protein Ku